MLPRMTDEDGAIVLEPRRACRSRRGAEGRDGRRSPEALHHFAVHDIARRASPAAFGPRNSVWERFRRLSRAGVSEAFSAALAGLSRTAHPVRMSASTAGRNRAAARGRGIRPVIPHRSTAKARPAFVPKALHRARARVERLAGELERLERIALRCEKTDRNFASVVALALALGFILVRSVHTA